MINGETKIFSNKLTFNLNFFDVYENSRNLFDKTKNLPKILNTHSE